MKMAFTLIFPVLWSSPALAGKAPSAEDVLGKFIDAGIKIENIRAEPREPEKPLPNSFDERFAFSDPSLPNGKGGQIFTCRKKKYCDALVGYFDMFKSFAGPYIYQSRDGLVVLQLNGGHSPGSAEKYEAVIDSLK